MHNATTTNSLTRILVYFLSRSRQTPSKLVHPSGTRCRDTDYVTNFGGFRYLCAKITSSNSCLNSTLRPPFSLIYKPSAINPLTPNDLYMSRTALLTSKHYILYIYSTNVGTEYFKHALYSPFFSLQNAVCFIIITSLVSVLFTFYIQGVLKLKKIIPAPKG